MGSTTTDSTNQATTRHFIIETVYLLYAPEVLSNFKGDSIYNLLVQSMCASCINVIIQHTLLLSDAIDVGTVYIYEYLSVCVPLR